MKSSEVAAKIHTVRIRLDLLNVTAIMVFERMEGSAKMLTFVKLLIFAPRAQLVSI